MFFGNFCSLVEINTTHWVQSLYFWILFGKRKTLRFHMGTRVLSQKTQSTAIFFSNIHLFFLHVLSKKWDKETVCISSKICTSTQTAVHQKSHFPLKGKITNTANTFITPFIISAKYKQVL
jgi:hypothetical protein